MVREDQKVFETFKEKDTEVLGNTINTTKRFDKSEMFWREAQQVWAEELKFLAETSRSTETPLSGKGQTKGGLDNSNSPNSVNGWSNKSVVTEFILLGLSSSQELQLVLFLVFSVFYGAAVLGNILIILTVITDSRLHSPMYFLLSNLSFIDVCQATFATPKMIADFLNEHKTITFQGCMSQIFFLHVFGGSEMVLLVAMAYDRYIAICRPLHYLAIMSRRVCAALVGVSWAIGILHSASHLAFTVDLPFCGPNKVDNFFCDLPLVIKLACLDTYVLEILVLTNSGLLSLICFLLLLVSYTVILATVHHQASGGMSKALSTLSAHITVVVLFFGPLIFIYIWPFESFPIDKFISVFFTVFTPFLNPMIYTLRNKDVKEAMKKLKSRMLVLSRFSRK
ncbi:olfactory receptor 4K3-like [Sciurus carolinensis]|uniref:olfactory receptor 4K3-like n=1 Tax=Sciurus carolinensis TaxID=30640 RepID=UPI001FB435DE|nr:olfactory receptor 4K3-like [Sciurus carolinensis]